MLSLLGGVIGVVLGIGAVGGRDLRREPLSQRHAMAVDDLDQGHPRVAWVLRHRWACSSATIPPARPAGSIRSNRSATNDRIRRFTDMSFLAGSPTNDRWVAKL